MHISLELPDELSQCFIRWLRAKNGYDIRGDPVLIAGEQGHFFRFLRHHLTYRPDVDGKRSECIVDLRNV